MTFNEAIKYCEQTKCEDCEFVLSKRADCRSTYEKEVLHIPCLINLVSPEEKDIYKNKKV